MKKVLLLAVVAVVAAVSSPALAASTSSDNKVVAGCKAVGRGIMWGPKQVCKGLKAVGKKVTGK